MSIFDDIGNAVSSVVNDVGQVASDAANLIGDGVNAAETLATDGLNLAGGAANLVVGLVGDAVNTAMQGATALLGMPNFIADDVAKIVDSVVKLLTQGGNPAATQAAANNAGGAGQDFVSNLVQQIENAMQSLLNQGQNNTEGSGGAKGAKSWLEVIAAAFGQIAGQQAQNLTDLATKISGEAQSDPKTAMADQTQFQADSQMFGITENAFSTALKSIGEGVQKMADKN